MKINYPNSSFLKKGNYMCVECKESSSVDVRLSDETLKVLGWLLFLLCLFSLDKLFSSLWVMIFFFW